MSENQVEGSGAQKKGKKGTDHEAGDKSTKRKGKDEKQTSDSGTVLGEMNDTTKKDAK